MQYQPEHLYWLIKNPTSQSTKEDNHLETQSILIEIKALFLITTPYSYINFKISMKTPCLELYKVLGLI